MEMPKRKLSISCKSKIFLVDLWKYPKNPTEASLNPNNDHLPPKSEHLAPKIDHH